MPKEKNKCSCSENQPGAGNPAGGPMEISPNALELLWHATVPIEFDAAVREAMSAQINVVPTGATALHAPLTTWPERIPWDMGSEAFYLNDLVLDLRGVVHMNLDLLQLVGCPMGRLMFWRAGNDENEEDGNRRENGDEQESLPCDWVILTFEPEVRAAQLPPEGFSPKMQELAQLGDEEAFAGLTFKASARVRFNTQLNRLKFQIKVAATYRVSTSAGDRRIRLETVVAESRDLEFAGRPGVTQEAEKNATFGIRFVDLQLALRANEKNAARQMPDPQVVAFGASVVTRVDQVDSEFVLVVSVEGEGESPGRCPDSRKLSFNVRRAGKTQTEVIRVG